jgi:hypothetical protein
MLRAAICALIKFRFYERICHIMSFTITAATIYSALRETEDREGLKVLVAQRITKFNSGQDLQP